MPPLAAMTPVNILFIALGVLFLGMALLQPSGGLTGRLKETAAVIGESKVWWLVGSAGVALLYVGLFVPAIE
jgi:hypothetical protein